MSSSIHSCVSPCASHMVPGGTGRIHAVMRSLSAFDFCLSMKDDLRDDIQETPARTLLWWRVPLLPALSCSPHGILAISVGGKRIGPVDLKPFIDQLKSSEAPCLRISIVLHVLIIYLNTCLFGCEELRVPQENGALAFPRPLPSSAHADVHQ